MTLFDLNSKWRFITRNANYVKIVAHKSWKNTENCSLKAFLVGKKLNMKDPHGQRSCPNPLRHDMAKKYLGGLSCMEYNFEFVGLE